MDEDLHTRINALVDEEHALLRSRSGGGLDEDEHARLRAVEEGLDQAWDLLRQRQARRAAGQDPAEAHERSTAVVENYLE